MADRRNNWRPRFSLRTLLIATALAAVIAAWFTQSALRQRRAVAELTKLGADVLYEHQVDPQSTSWCPESLRQWLGVDFFAEATEAYFGYDATIVFDRGRSAAGQNTVVLSENSRILNQQRSRPGITLRPAARPPPTMIGEDAMQQLRRLPYLRKLTLRALTTNQAKTFPRLVLQYSPAGAFVLDAQSLQRLRDHPTLDELDLTSMPADDEVLAGLHDFQQVKRLFLGAPRFSEQGGKHLATLPNLEKLTFATEKVASGSIDPPHEPWPMPENFPELPNLRELHIPRHVFANETARCLTGLSRLETLDCGSIAVDDEGIRFFASLPQLRELNLLDSRITDSGAEHLGKLTELRRLILTNNRITDDGLRHLATLTKLETLYLPHLPITDAGLAHLRGATAMQQLMLSGTKITDAGLVHLSGMSDLWSLDLSFTAITDESIDQLLRFKKLTNLRLLGTRITRQGAGRLRQAFPATATDVLDAADST